MATKKLTCTADVSISEQYSGNAYNASNRLAFGRGAASGDRYYALLKFSSLSLDPDLYEITKAVLTVTKITGAVGFTASMNARALRVTSSWSESTTWGNRPSTTTSGQSSAVAMGEGHSGSVNFDVTDIVLAWQGGSGQYGVCLQQSDSTASRIKTIADSTSGNAAYITVTYSERNPEPTTPKVTAPGAVTTDSATFKWTASGDNVFASDKLSYQVQVSLDGGSTWSSTYTASAGATSLTVNLRTLAGLKAKQYYYNTKLKVRVRAVTPTFNGKVYYSSWGVSTVGTINYKITPSKPSSLTLSAAAPYEGQQITITLGRPASYNAYDSSGAAMQLTYTVKLKDGTTLGAVTASCTSATAALTITVPNKTSSKSNLSTNVTATVKDAHSQTSAATSEVSLTIKRYRAPVVTLSKIDRAENEAAVTAIIMDTGYAGSQSNNQITKLEYKLANGNWTAVTPTWSGLKAAFLLSGLSAGSRYALQVRVTNTAPSGLTAKTATAPGTVLEHTPAAMVYRDSANDATGIAAKSLIVGEDWNHHIAEGDARVEGTLSVGDLVFRSEWVDMTLDAAFVVYADTADYRPMYRVCGNMVTVKGVLAPAAAFESSTTSAPMASGIPKELRPQRALYWVCQGSGMNRWTCSVRTGGTVCIERYGITEPVTIPTSAWLPFCVTYMIDRSDIVENIDDTTAILDEAILDEAILE